MNAVAAKALMSDILIDIDIRSNYFELFGIPVGYDVHRGSIQGRYLDLQRVVHPDRFVGLGDRGQRMAVQYAAFVNEAFDTLCSPLKRALYLLEISGHPVDVERNTVMDTSFLMEQLSLREDLGEVRDSVDPETAVEAVKKRAEDLMAGLQDIFVTSFQAGTDAGFLCAADAVKKMHFAEKLVAEAEQLEEDIFDS